MNQNVDQYIGLEIECKVIVIKCQAMSMIVIVGPLNS